MSFFLVSFSLSCDVCRPTHPFLGRANISSGMDRAGLWMHRSPQCSCLTSLEHFGRPAPLVLPKTRRRVQCESSVHLRRRRASQTSYKHALIWTCYTLSSQARKASTVTSAAGSNGFLPESCPPEGTETQAQREREREREREKSKKTKPLSPFLFPCLPQLLSFAFSSASNTSASLASGSSLLDPASP